MAIPERRRFEVPYRGPDGAAIAVVELVHLAPAELPFVVLMTDERPSPPDLTKLRDAIAIYGAIRTFSVSIGPAPGAAMVEALAGLSPTFRQIAAPALAARRDAMAKAARAAPPKAGAA